MSSVVPGYAGKILRVNLSKGHTSEEVLDAATLRKYVGGACLGAKYLYEEVPPGVQWSDPENRLILASGPLGGTRMAGSGSFSVVTKGCLTNGATSTQANGFFGAFLKFSGFDGIVIQGAAQKWVYLYIHDGIAEIRDASHLVGKDTYETEDAIKKELGKGERELSVASIGPAGENLVKFAGIFADKGHAAAHNGTGAVMGSKKLKAVAAARGKGNVTVKDKEAISALSKEILEAIKATPGGKDGFDNGTLNGYKIVGPLGGLPIRNNTTNVYPDADKLAQYNSDYIHGHFDLKPHSCWACQQHHSTWLTIKEGRYTGQAGEEPEYEGLASWGSVTGPADVNDAIVLSWLTDRLGMDVNEAGWVVGMAMECYGKGILTKRDTDGLELTWGNVETTKALLNKIARREGFGNILAEGTMRAAQKIGEEAQKVAVYTMKGTPIRGHDHRAIWFEMFETNVASTGVIETAFVYSPARLGLGTQAGLAQLFNPVDVSTLSAKLKGAAQFEDSLVVCRFNIRSDIAGMCKVLNAATGWDFTQEEALMLGKRAVNLFKAFNIRHGIGEELDNPSPRYASPAVDGPAKGIDIRPHWDKMKRDYYEMMGWDRQTSKPLPDTLKKLGIEHVIPDLWAK